MSSYQDVKHTAPVIILSPTARNGITLIQRLLNSSRQIIIYGENSILMNYLPMLVYTQIEIQTHAEAITTARNRFLEQNEDFWTSNLVPDMEPLVAMSHGWYYDLVKHYAACSKVYGYERWGIKSPMESISTFDRARELLPDAKIIFLYRNLYDVLCSAKARRFILSGHQFMQYIRDWIRHVEHISNQDMRKIFVLRYEDLLARIFHGQV